MRESVFPERLASASRRSRVCWVSRVEKYDVLPVLAGRPAPLRRPPRPMPFDFVISYPANVIISDGSESVKNIDCVLQVVFS